MDKQLSLLLVGCGNMGQALMGGWIAMGVAPINIRVIDPGAGAKSACTAAGVSCMDNIGALDNDFAPDAILFAVKPQMIADTAPQYLRFSKDALFISIVAGTRINWFENLFGQQAAILRVMPNTPALVQKGISALSANGAVSDSQRNLGQSLFKAVGEVVWLDQEDHIDAVTALSGSGPAYIFLLIEAMANAGKQVGLPEETADQLARQTVIGAAHLAAQSDLNPETLRKNVTSPGGTTAAALEVLMADGGMSDLLAKAIAAATARAEELGKAS